VIVAVCGSVLQCVAVCGSVLQCVAVCCRQARYYYVRCSVMQGVLQCVAHTGLFYSLHVTDIHTGLFRYTYRPLLWYTYRAFLLAICSGKICVCVVAGGSGRK